MYSNSLRSGRVGAFGAMGLLLIAQAIPACANATYSFAADFVSRTAPSGGTVWWYS